jgi:hypothetical protein
MEYAPVAVVTIGLVVVCLSVWLIRKSTSEPPNVRIPEPDPSRPPVPESAPDERRDWPAVATLVSEPPTAPGPAPVPFPYPAEHPVMQSIPWQPHLPLDPPAQDVPTFRIVALGLAGSGKTVFLSSLFHELHHPVSTRPYFLTTDMKRRDILSSLYGEVVAPPPRPWPPGTRVAEVDEFTMDGVYCHPAGRRQTVMRIEYLDYDGDLLAPGGWAYRQHPELEVKVKRAHALLGILDGSRVRDLLMRRPGADNYFESELDSMIGVLNEASCPVHLLITKWDVVRDYGEHPRASDDERLRDVGDALMRHPHFAALPNARTGPPVRLIPVSAVGSRFAQLDPAGNSQKRVGGVVDPENLDVPLCAVLPDLFERVQRVLDEPERRRLLSARTLHGITEVLMEETVNQKLLEYLPWPVKASAGPLLAYLNRRTRLAERSEVEPEQLAHEEIMRHFIGRLESFQLQFPSSNLSVRRT